MATYTPDIHNSLSTPPHPPPPPPPKPGSHDATRISTPTTFGTGRAPDAAGYVPGPVAAGYGRGGGGGGGSFSPPTAGPASHGGGHVPFPSSGLVQAPETQDPGDQWLPQILQDKPKQDITDILSNPALLSALTHSPSTIHPSLATSHSSLQAALDENIELAAHLADLETRLARQRAATQAQLLSTHALDRQWRQKQSDMDHALAPFAPASLYQRVSQGVQEQAAVCHALEESFLEGEEEGSTVTEREVGDWVRRYREARVQYYLRQERKERWDEGRVGGWR